MWWFLVGMGVLLFGVAWWIEKRISKDF